MSTNYTINNVFFYKLPKEQRGVGISSSVGQRGSRYPVCLGRKYYDEIMRLSKTWFVQAVVARVEKITLKSTKGIFVAVWNFEKFSFVKKKVQMKIEANFLLRTYSIPIVYRITW